MKQEDSTLPPESQQAVVKYADLLLRKASAKGRFPTPVADLVSAAGLEIARESALERLGIDTLYRRLPNSMKLMPDVLKRAAGKVLGLVYRPDRMIHLDPSLHPKKRTYLTVHEVGHEFLPHQRKTFAILEDSEAELDPETQDLYEREANVFASEVLFQGELFAMEAGDSRTSIDVPINLSKKYGPSIYASARRYVSTHREPCALVSFNPPTQLIGVGEVLELRRIVTSPTFQRQFGVLQLDETWREGTFFYAHRPRHKFTRGATCTIRDINGDAQTFVAEAFDTTYLILYLLYMPQLARRAG